METLVVDGAAIDLVAVGAGANSAELALVGGIAWLLGAPLVHAAHGHGWKALGSGAMRVGASAVVLAVLASTCCHERPKGSAGDGAFVSVAVLTFPTVIALDAAVLARDEPLVEPPSVAWLPSLSLTRDHVTVGIQGAF